jgi:hypothetical protein
MFTSHIFIFSILTAAFRTQIMTVTTKTFSQIRYFKINLFFRNPHVCYLFLSLCYFELQDVLLLQTFRPFIQYLRLNTSGDAMTHSTMIPTQHTEVYSFLKSLESLPGRHIFHFYKFQIFLTVSSQIN